MIKKIFKKFHIMLFIPIIMIVCVFVDFEKEDNSFLLEYHEPIKWIDPRITAHEIHHINYAKEFILRDFIIFLPKAQYFLTFKKFETVSG